MYRFALALSAIVLSAMLPARADIASDARRLLAYQIRQAGGEPKSTQISVVRVSRDTAHLSWLNGTLSGQLTLTRKLDRWWWLADQNAATAGYAFRITFAKSDATGPVAIAPLYVREPTPAEMLPTQAPAPGWGSSNAVCFFDIALARGSAVDYAAGTTIDVWFPFVLDDQFVYDVSFTSGGRSVGPIHGTIFDNVVHVVLPAFTLRAGQPLMAEIDGDPPASSLR